MDYANAPSNEYPLRILVPSDSVGAIIGKQGSTIKMIKQAAHAKIDVNKSEPSNTQERVISIRGQQDNCSQACREILRIMYEDARIKNKTNEIILKVLAHNNFIGRIIGKAGNIINTIKKDTNTNITVSSINELNSFNLERVISIKGEFEQQIHALVTVYGKLCMAYENDNARTWNYSASSYPSPAHLLQPFGPQAVMMATGTNGVPSLFPPQYAQPPQSLIQQTPTSNSNNSSNKYMEPASSQAAMYHQSYYPPIFPVSGSHYYMSYPPFNAMVPPYPHQYANMPTNTNGNLAHQHSQSGAPSAVIETVHLYVPNTVIGAIIGTKGLFIKSIINNSNASVKISTLNSHEDQNKIIDRQITITGTPEAQWKSQYYIYDKIRQEGYAGEDEVRLRAEIYVPTSLIGRLVGKGGQNLRQLQQATGATIKLPENSQNTSANEVPVKIIGPFQASQFAQRRIQSIIQMSRDSINTSNDDSNNNNNNNNNNTNNNIHNNNTTNDTCEQSNHELSNNLDEISTMANGSTTSDDTVVASSTIQNFEDSTTAVAEKKPSDE